MHCCNLTFEFTIEARRRSQVDGGVKRDTQRDGVVSSPVARVGQKPGGRSEDERAGHCGCQPYSSKKDGYASCTQHNTAMPVMIPFGTSIIEPFLLITAGCNKWM